MAGYASGSEEEDVGSKGNTQLQRDETFVQGGRPKWALEVCPSLLNPKKCIASMIKLCINGDGMYGYFRNVHSAIVNSIYPDLNYYKAGMISAEEFATVCRYYVKARCDYVYQRVTGDYLSNAVPYPVGIRLPKSIADPINLLGVAQLELCGPQVCPCPEETRDWIPANIDELKVAFHRLVLAAEMRGYLSTENLWSEVTGSCWYAIGVVKLDDNNVIADQENDVHVQSCFKANQEDVVLAAIIQRGFDGIISELSSIAPFQTQVFECMSKSIQYVRGA